VLLYESTSPLSDRILTLTATERPPVSHSTVSLLTLLSVL